MPYQNAWFIQDKVLLQKFWGDFTDAELQACEEEMAHYLEQSNASKVHLLLEVDNVITMPSIKSVRQMTINRNPKHGWVVAYGLRRHRYVRALLLFTLLLFNLHYKIVDDQQQALEFLRTLDATLLH